MLALIVVVAIAVAIIVVAVVLNLGTTRLASRVEATGTKTAVSEVVAGQSVVQAGDPDELRSQVRTPPVTTIDLQQYDQLMEQTDEWESERGHHDAINLRPDYAGYPDSALVELAAGGDRLAYSFLAGRNHASAPLTAIEWYMGAAVLGSTMATLGIAEIYERLATVGEGLPDDRSLMNDFPSFGMQDTAAMSEALAWAYVTEMRGDPLGSALRDKLLNSYPIDEEQIAAACSLAQVNYDSLAIARGEMAIAMLDNSPRPITSHPFVPGRGCDNWPFRRPLCTEVLIGRSVDSVVKVATAYICTKQ